MAAPCTTLSGEWAESGKPLAVIFLCHYHFGRPGNRCVRPALYHVHRCAEQPGNSPWITTVAAAVICGVVLLGGVKSIGGFCEADPRHVPHLCGGSAGRDHHKSGTCARRLCGDFPYAFAPMPAVGGLAGSTVALALRQGAARGPSPTKRAAAHRPSPMRPPSPITPLRRDYGCFEVFCGYAGGMHDDSPRNFCAGPEIGSPAWRRRR